MQIRKLSRGIAVVLSVSAVGVSTVPSTTYASGFPVVDLASIAQAVTDYTQQLEQYAELIETTVLNAEQLAQAITLYEQTMVEYEHMLNQMQELEDKLDPKDWSEIYATYQDILNRYPGSSPDYSTPEWDSANEELGHVYYRGDTLANLETAVNDLPLDPDSAAFALKDTRDHYARSQLATAQLLTVKDMDEQLEELTMRSEDVDAARYNLGPEDHLKTLQVLAEQNQIMLEAMQQQIAVSNAQLQYSNQLDTHYFANQNQARQATLMEIQARHAEALTVDETPLVTY